MKKVLYVITSLSHKRTILSFQHRTELEQLALLPVPIVTNKVIPENHDELKIKHKTHGGPQDIQKIVNQYSPDFYVQSDISPIHKKIKLSNSCKRIYLSHGVIGNHLKGMVKQCGFNVDVWKGMNLYCGAGNVFLEWLMEKVKISKENVLLDAVPQFDLLLNKSFFDLYKNKLLLSMKKQYKHCVLFCGFCCRNRYDFNDHNEDYFKTAIELARIAKKYNILVMIKPRQTHSEMIKFLYDHKKCWNRWPAKYIHTYNEIRNAENLHFITTTCPIHYYFFADLFVCNGCSTVEMEACALGKPLLIVKTKTNPVGLDPFNTISNGVATRIENLNDLEHKICYSLNNIDENSNKQMTFVKNFGITLDGFAYKRVQDRLLSM